MEVALNNSLQVKFRQVTNYNSFDVLDEKVQRNIFSETWNSIAFNVGMRKKLSDYELKVIFEFVSTYFKKLNLSDIRQAFGLYSANQLTFMVNGKKQTTVGHFQSFDNVFVGAVLKSYSDYTEGKNQIKIMQTNLEPKEKCTKENAKESYDYILKCYKDGKEPWIANWNFAFRYMQVEKIISYSNDEKQMFKEFVIEELREEIVTLKHKRKDVSDVERVLNDENKLADECRKRIVKKYFENEYKIES